MSSQQIVKQCFRNWKAYFRALREFNTSPTKFKAKPGLPKYKKEQFAVFFTGQQIKSENGYVHFPRGTIDPVKTKLQKICQVRVIPQTACHVIEIVYEKEEVENENIRKQNVLSLDLGISNLCSGSNNVGLEPFLINGNPLKALNQWYNKTKANLQSLLGPNRYKSRRINRLTHYRNCWMEDKMHKTSRFIVDYCLEHAIGTIIVGKIKTGKPASTLDQKIINNSQ